MSAEVISIGDELTSGQRLDTNSQWLSERLGELGVRVLFHTTVADDLAANVRVFQQAIDRAEIVVATGGLGPTADDLTREALAAATGTELVLNEAELEQIRNLFARRGREMPPRNRVQAMFPAGSRVIPNPHGTAPGIFSTVERSGKPPCHFFALPGVPAEMREMWKGTVADAIRAATGSTRIIRHRRLKCFGVGESDLEQMLPDIIRRGRVPQVGITVSGATITLRITAEGATPEECDAVTAPTIATIHECLGELVFGQEDDELEDAVARLLNDQNVTLSTVEWGTAGLIAQWLGALPAANGHFAGGLVVTEGARLKSLLGLPEDLIARREAAGDELVKAMAAACQARFGSDYALAVGPFSALNEEASKSGDGSSLPPRSHFAVARPGRVTAHSSPLAGHPEIVRPRAAKQALDLVRRSLLT